MITAIVLYDLPASIGLEECRKHFTMIAPDFLKAPGFVRKQFICKKDGGIAGGVYMWETQQAAEAFYTGPWRDGIRCPLRQRSENSIFRDGRTDRPRLGLCRRIRL